MATNLETKNTVERDETKEGLAELKKEVESNPIDKRVYLEVDTAFNKFVKETDAKVRLEKNVKDGKLKLISHGGTCELDLKSRKISFIKGNSKITLENEGKKFNADNFMKTTISLDENSLLKTFRKMEVINKAISISKKHPNNRKFYFEKGNIIQRNTPGLREYIILKVDGEDVAYSGDLKKAGFDLSYSHYYTDNRRSPGWDDLLETLNEIVA